MEERRNAFPSVCKEARLTLPNLLELFSEAIRTDGGAWKGISDGVSSIIWGFMTHQKYRCRDTVGRYHLIQP